MNRFDVIWGRASRVLAFLTGIGMMAYETIWDRADRPWLYFAAVGMMGLPIANAAEKVVTKIARKNGDLPEEKP